MKRRYLVGKAIWKLDEPPPQDMSRRRQGIQLPLAITLGAEQKEPSFYFSDTENIYLTIQVPNLYFLEKIKGNSCLAVKESLVT